MMQKHMGLCYSFFNKAIYVTKRMQISLEDATLIIKDLFIFIYRPNYLAIALYIKRCLILLAVVSLHLL